MWCSGRSDLGFPQDPCICLAKNHPLCETRAFKEILKSLFEVSGGGNTLREGLAMAAGNAERMLQ